MAEGDAKKAGENKDELKKGKSDVGVSSHEDMGVRVTRDLNAGGSVARGYSSGMSKMNFSSRGMPREEVVDDEDPAPAKPIAAAPVQMPSPASPPATPAEPANDGALAWLTGLFKSR
jgi:hypothetical protein